MTAPSPDFGARRFHDLIAALPSADPRTAIDTASLKHRFPHLAPVDVRDMNIRGPYGNIPARAYVGPDRAGPGLVWVHGGAFVTGSLDMPESNWVALELAVQGIPVVTLDYRKALGGVHHPVLSDEVLVGWLATISADLLGVPVDQLHLGGASAGANLVAGVTGRLLRESRPVPASLVLVYPVLHAIMPVPQPDAARAIGALAPEFRFTPQFMRAISLNYVGDSQLLHDPVAFPAHGIAAGLPRTLVINAEADDLRPSGEAYADQLTAADVPVEVLFEPGTVHGYLDEPGLPAALSTIGRIARWVRPGQTHG